MKHINANVLTNLKVLSKFNIEIKLRNLFLKLFLTIIHFVIFMFIQEQRQCFNFRIVLHEKIVTF